MNLHRFFFQSLPVRIFPHATGDTRRGIHHATRPLTSIAQSHPSSLEGSSVT